MKNLKRLLDYSKQERVEVMDIGDVVLIVLFISGVLTFGGLAITFHQLNKEQKFVHGQLVEIWKRIESVAKALKDAT